MVVRNSKSWSSTCITACWYISPPVVQGSWKSIHNKIFQIIGICQGWGMYVYIWAIKLCKSVYQRDKAIEINVMEDILRALISDEFRRDMIYYNSYIARNIMLLYLRSIAWGINGVHSSKGTNCTYTLSPLIWMENFYPKLFQFFFGIILLSRPSAAFINCDLHNGWDNWILFKAYYI